MTRQNKARKKSDEIVDALALEIQAGILPPGIWLKQIDIETRYKAPRLDVRRALDKLVVKRLVQHVPNRGYHVYAPDRRQSAEQREVRVILETAAAERMAGRATADDIADLTALATRFSDLVMQGTLMEQYEANLAFHMRMLQLCPNHELAALVTDTRGRGPSALITQWKTRARVEQSAKEHFAIVEALAAADAPRLKELIAQHIRQAETPDTDLAEERSDERPLPATPR